jgi:glyoxylase-like metal-dependent hydrolase (beta-lactamase superfamily II)
MILAKTMSISIDDRIFDIAPDIKGLRLPMPPPLDWINAWFLRHETGWFIVDTGYNTPDSREILEEMIANHLDGLPITGVIVTHYHPDHIGQAGWICKKFNCPIYMSPKEWLLGRLLSTDNSGSYQEMVTNYYRKAGTPDELLQVFSERGNSFLRTTDEVPAQYHRLEEGAYITIGNRKWRILIGQGHSPEMVLLYDETGKLLISGDQIVARITPNISVWPFDIYANTLADFLHTSETLPTLVPNDVNVLPGHGRPFDNFHERILGYLPFHEGRLNKLRAGLTGDAQSLHELLKVLFPRELGPRDYVFAMGETHSHVNYLVSLGEVERRQDNTLMFHKK